MSPATTDPTVDGNGVAVDGGELYYNTVSNVIRFYDSTDWVDVATRVAGVIDVRDFGAVGDRVTDDAAAIQAAIDWSEDNGNPAIRIPVAQPNGVLRGYYKCKSALVIRDNTHVFGEGRFSSELRFNNDTHGFSTDRTAGICSNWSVTNLHIRGNADTSASVAKTAMFDIGPSNYFNISDIYGQRFVLGFNFNAESTGLALGNVSRVQYVCSQFPNPVNGYPENAVKTSGVTKKPQAINFTDCILYAELNVAERSFSPDGTETDFEHTAIGGLAKTEGVQVWFTSPLGGAPVRQVEGTDYDLWDTTIYDPPVASTMLTPGDIYDADIDRITVQMASAPPAAINYDAETGAFTTGLTVTGGTSGATALIHAVVDNGTTGTLLLKSIVGTFVNNEVLTDSSTGSATANGVVYTGDLDVMWNDPTGLRGINIVSGTGLNFTGLTIGGWETGIYNNGDSNSFRLNYSQIAYVGIQLTASALNTYYYAGEFSRKDTVLHHSINAAAVGPILNQGAGRAAEVLECTVTYTALTSNDPIDWDGAGTTVLETLVYDTGLIREVTAVLSYSMIEAVGSRVRGLLTLQVSHDEGDTWSTMDSVSIDKNCPGLTAITDTGRITLFGQDDTTIDSQYSRVPIVQYRVLADRQNGDSFKIQGSSTFYSSLRVEHKNPS
jgi:hypothetical protein